MNTHFVPDNLTILVISRDRIFLRKSSKILKEQAYNVVTIRKVQEGLATIFQQPPDLAVLDLGRPLLLQFEEAWQSHKGQRVPYLVISKLEVSTEIADRLRAGADDYLVKPVGYPELAARVNAILRRRLGNRRHQKKPCLEIADLRIEATRHTVWVGEQEISLAPREHQLLTILAEKAGNVLSPEELACTIWSTAGVKELRALAVYVWRLRRKLEADPKNPDYLRTAIFRRGYYLRTEPAIEQVLPAKG